jgi:extracellular matrix protein 14
MFPYSFSCSEIPPTEENLFEAAIGAARALYFAHARSFEVGSVCDIGLATPGAAVDWTYAVGGVSWSWTIELRDRGVYGFLLPPDQIRGSGEEVSRALESLAEFVLTKEDMKRVVDKI